MFFVVPEAICKAPSCECNPAHHTDVSRAIVSARLYRIFSTDPLQVDLNQR